MRFAKLLAFTFALAILAGCGGGGTSSDGPSANASSAAQCTPTASISFGGSSSTVPAGSSTMVVEVLGVPDGAGTVQAEALTPGSDSFDLYTLSNGNCAAALPSAETGRSVALGQGQMSSTSRLFIALSSQSRMLVRLCAYNGTSSQPCDPTYATISGMVTDSNGAAIPGGTVSVVNNALNYQANTDANGLFVLNTPSSTLPPGFAVSVYDNSHAPLGLTFTSNATGVYSQSQPFMLPNNTPSRIALEQQPTVHHLGDSNYTGAINSQFQYPNAQGLSYTYTFNLTSASTAYANAIFYLTAKGIDCPNTVTINGAPAGTLAGTAADGSYTTQGISLSSSRFRTGANTLTITSVTCNGISDYDDFEFINPVITFH